MERKQESHQAYEAIEDRYRTALPTFKGKFQRRMMPFGLKDAPDTFEAIVDDVFSEFLGKGVLVDMDNILVYIHTVA